MPIPAKTIACGRVIDREGGSKTAPFTLPLPGACIIFEGYAFCNSPLRFRLAESLPVVFQTVYEYARDDSSVA